MATTRLRSPARGAIVVAAAALLAAGCGDEDGSSSTRPATTVMATTPGRSRASATTAAPAGVDEVVFVRYLGGRVVEGPRRATVDVGDVVQLQVEADVADEVHVHGYDLTAEVAPGRLAELRFEADIPGVFEVELERRGVTIVELTVR